MQKNVIGEDALLFTAARLLEMTDVIIARAFVQFAIPVGVAPTNIRRHRFARQIVWKNSLGSGLNERQAAQPFKQFVRALLCRRRWRRRHRQQFRHQRFGRESHQDTRFERGAMRGSRRFLRELFEQSFDHVGRGFRLKMKLAPLGEYIGDKRERERMPMSEIEHRVVLVGWHFTLEKIVAAFVGAEIAKRQNAQDALQTRIGTPGRRGRIPSGKNQERVRIQLRQKNLAQPGIERREDFVGIHEDDRTRGGSGW